MKTRKMTKALALGAAAGLVLAGCASDGGDEGNGDNGGGEDRSITLGYIE